MKSLHQRLAWLGAWPRLAALMTVCLAAAYSAVALKSVTVDEYADLPQGLGILRTGDLHLSTLDEPLPRVLPALPLALSSARLTPETFAKAESIWSLGGQFMQDNVRFYQDYFMAGRAVSALFLLLTWTLAIGLSKSLYGPAGAALTAACVCLSPNLLAHGTLVTPDIYLAAGVMGTLWAYLSLLRQPGFRAAVVLGVVFGLAVLTKFTALILGPAILVVTACLQRKPRAETVAGHDWIAGREAWLSLGLALLVTVLTINCGWGFAGTGQLLGDYPFATGPFLTLQRWLPRWLPIPFPTGFLGGMDAQLGETGYVAYLLGEFNHTGFWQYYLVALLVKTPIAILGLWLLAWLCDRRIRRPELILLATAGLALAFFSVARHKNIGVRYLLFLEPVLAVWAGRLALSPIWQHARRSLWLGATLAVLGASLVVGCIRTWPDYIAYFNEPSGGPDQGYRYLLDSNLDWGQDLIALKHYMDTAGTGCIDLAYFGRVDPRTYGICYKLLDPQATPRYAAISANLLWGRAYYVNGSEYWPDDPDVYAKFRRQTPEAILGHSIYIFKAPAGDSGR